MVKVASVRFSNKGRMYYFDKNNLDIKKGMEVVVETERGIQLGFIADSEKEIAENQIVSPLKKILRIASERDKNNYYKNLKDSSYALKKAKDIVEELNLTMNILDANYTLDRSQLLFMFTADERIDFRELAKRLAQIYKTRIELRQIGIRDKAMEIGGIGPCGRFLCCNSFLHDLNSVSINMAKNQMLSLSPTKINGVCGRLLCCLEYENDTYSVLKKGLPNVGNIADTSMGMGKVVSVDIFKRTYKVDLKDKGIVEFSQGDNDGSTK